MIKLSKQALECLEKDDFVELEKIYEKIVSESSKLRDSVPRSFLFLLHRLNEEINQSKKLKESSKII